MWTEASQRGQRLKVEQMTSRSKYNDEVNHAGKSQSDRTERRVTKASQDGHMPIRQNTQGNPAA
jgi:hypothetical protein